MRKPLGQRLAQGGAVCAALLLAGCTGAVERYAERPGLYRVQILPPHNASLQVAIRQAALFCNQPLPRNGAEAAAMADLLQMRQNTGYLTRTFLEFRCP